MKYILAAIITISIMYMGFKLTEKACNLIDKIFNCLEEKRKRKNEKY